MKIKRAAAVQASKNTKRDRIVLEHLPLVKAIAVRVHENLPVHVDLDDLVHAGVLGLFDAATKYNPDKKVVFSSYAKHRIKGAILDSLRQLDWASRDLRRRHKQVEAVTRELSSVLHRAPTESEIAERLGIDVERWRQMMMDLRNVGLVSASVRSGDHEDLPAPDFPSKPETQPDHMCARRQMRSVLGTAVKTLPERYQKVVLLYYTNEMTMKEIGGVLGINESRVSQIHKSALEENAHRPAIKRHSIQSRFLKYLAARPSGGGHGGVSGRRMMGLWSTPSIPSCSLSSPKSSAPSSGMSWDFRRWMPDMAGSFSLSRPEKWASIPRPLRQKTESTSFI